MKGLLQGLGRCSWDELGSLGMTHWLWVDTAREAVRLESRLGAPPREASHVWGWSGDECVRLRLDPDLPGGMVGARLRIGDADPVDGWESVEVERRDAQAWRSSDARVAATYPAGLSDHQPICLWTVRRFVDGVATPLQFLQM